MELLFVTFQRRFCHKFLENKNSQKSYLLMNKCISYDFSLSITMMLFSFDLCDIVIFSDSNSSEVLSQRKFVWVKKFRLCRVFVAYLQHTYSWEKLSHMNGNLHLNDVKKWRNMAAVLATTTEIESYYNLNNYFDLN